MGHNNNKSLRGTMNFGSLEKYNGLGETPKALGFGPVKTTPVSTRNSKIYRDKFIQQALGSTVQHNEKIPEGHLGYTKTETLLNDNYLPALRNFSTTQRVVR
jgi:hypothetical protein